MEYCKYGCGREGKFKLRDMSLICEDSYNKCPANKAKNSKGIKKAHNEGRMKSDFGGNRGWRKGRNSHNDSRIKTKYSKEILFVKDGINHRSDLIKKAYINSEQASYECVKCGISEWENSFISLHLDHINGDKNDNRLKNLRLLCPNCHSQTSTYCRHNSNSKTDEEYIDALLNSNLIIYKALKELNVVTGGTNWKRAKRLIEKHDLARVAERQTRYL